MSRYALVDAQGVVQNVIVWDGVTPLDFGDLTAVPEKDAPAFRPVRERGPKADVEIVTDDVAALRAALVKKGVITEQDVEAEKPKDEPPDVKGGKR